MPKQYIYFRFNVVNRSNTGGKVTVIYEFLDANGNKVSAPTGTSTATNVDVNKPTSATGLTFSSGPVRAQSGTILDFSDDSTFNLNNPPAIGDFFFVGYTVIRPSGTSSQGILAGDIDISGNEQITVVLTYQQAKNPDPVIPPPNEGAFIRVIFRFFDVNGNIISTPSSRPDTVKVRFDDFGTDITNIGFNTNPTNNPVLNPNNATLTPASQPNNQIQPLNEISLSEGILYNVTNPYTTTAYSWPTTFVSDGVTFVYAGSLSNSQKIIKKDIDGNALSTSEVITYYVDYIALPSGVVPEIVEDEVVDIPNVVVVPPTTPPPPTSPPPPPTTPPLTPPTINTCPIVVNVLFTNYNNDAVGSFVRVNGSSVGIDVKNLGGGNFKVTYPNAVSGESYNFSFQDINSYATPSSINASSCNTYSVTYNRTVPPKPVLIIDTEYIPFPDIPFTKGQIFVDGASVGFGKVTLSLNPGEYIVTFGDVLVTGYTFTTPTAIRVVLDSTGTKRVIGVYTGFKNPLAYWLKPIDDIDSQYYAQEKIEGLWSDDIRNLTTMYTASMTASMLDYAVYVYQENPTIVTSSIQFSLSYGHYYGFGSDDDDATDFDNTPTKGVYGQYRNKILENAKGKFNLTGTETNHFYVINYTHERLQNALDFGAFEINLASLSGSQYIAANEKATHTGSNVTLAGDGSVIRLVSDNIKQVGVYGTAYNIVSGTIEDGIYNANNPHVYGKMYINHGAVLLDADKLDESASFGTVDVREVDGRNFMKLYTSISGAAQLTDDSGDLLGLKARRKVLEFNDLFFLRVENKEFNRSNNASYFSGSEGTVILEDIRNNPVTYITTIGLYNDQRELLAVGKLSKPVKNNFTTERLFKVRVKH